MAATQTAPGKELDARKRSSTACHFEQALRKKIVGQEEAVQALVDLYQVFCAGLQSPGRPVGNLLFLGPTGSGKTRTVEAAAEILFGDSRVVIKVDCAEFQHSHEIAKLIGSPPGYLGHRETHPLITQEALAASHRDHLKLSFLLFDEIEKASDALWQLLLGILDKATLTLGDNRKVDLSQTVIFLTSNLGGGEITELMEGGMGFIHPKDTPAAGLDAKVERTAVESARRKFSPAFMNRLDSVVVFHPLKREELDEVPDIKERLSSLGVEMVGSSLAFEQALQLVEAVAPNDSGVLLQGETGTGKELFARAIHMLSSRQHGPFVTLNCAAIPAGLVESELFGHERGAFTGAMAPMVGRFQLADKGTLFLDEIGELPLEIQPKLLRSLQEHEYQRLGSGRTMRADVRIVAATNQDLEEMVRERKFRPDLYFRLNVFPIVLPPLRARAEDIPELVQYFVRKLSGQLKKQIEHVPAEVMDILRAHEWSGNVRELENFVHRSMILSKGAILRPPLAELRAISKSSPQAATATLAELEREHIVQALRETNGLVGGRDGAAARLGIPRTTLVYRMRKLGIPMDKFSGCRRSPNRSVLH